MPKSVRFHKVGGPEVLQLEEVGVGDPGMGSPIKRPLSRGKTYPVRENLFSR